MNHTSRSCRSSEVSKLSFGRQLLFSVMVLLRTVPPSNTWCQFWPGASSEKTLSSGIFHGTQLSVAEKLYHSPADVTVGR